MTGGDAPSRLRTLLAGIAHAPMRFPVSLGCALLWAALTIADTHNIDPFDRLLRQQIQVFLLLGFFASLTAKLFAEGRDWPARRWLPLTLAALALPALAVFTGAQGREAFEGPAFLFMGPGLVLLMTVAPFIRRGAVDHALWQFNFWSWTSAAFGLLVALALAIGLSTGYRAVEVLFEADLPSRLWTDTWILCMSVVWPWQTLAGVPGALAPRDEDYCPRWAVHVISWVLLPIALAYLLLLYGFAAKTTVQWALPRGTISWLVAGFAGFGLAVWMAAWPLRRTGNPLVRLYHRFFHAALFVPVALLAVGTGERVADYGITEPRYGLILLALWLGGIAVYGVSKRPPRLAAAPLAFGLMLVAGALGPWGAGAISLRSQLGQLEAMLGETGHMVGGRIEPYAGRAEFEQSKRISSIVRYLSAGSRKDALRTWVEDSGGRWPATGDAEAIVTALGPDYVDRYENARDTETFHYEIDEAAAVNVDGYDVVGRFNIYARGSIVTLRTGRRDTEYKLSIAGDEPSVLVTATDGSQARLDLGEMISVLESGFDDREGDARRSAMTAEELGDGLAARLELHALGGHRERGEPRLDRAAGWILIARPR